jgi:hypothetical protein
MSSKPAARVMNMNDEYEIIIDDDQEVVDESFTVGYPESGPIYLTSHECPFCHSMMETIGVGFGDYYCSNCWAMRSRKVLMKPRHQLLEEE